MRFDNAFGLSRRAGSVNQISRGVGVDWQIEIARIVFVWQFVHVDHDAATVRQAMREFEIGRVGDEQRRARVFQNETRSGFGISAVERNAKARGFQNAQNRRE